MEQNQIDLNWCWQYHLKSLHYALTKCNQHNTWQCLPKTLTERFRNADVLKCAFFFFQKQHEFVLLSKKPSPWQQAYTSVHFRNTFRRSSLNQFSTNENFWCEIGFLSFIYTLDFSQKKNSPKTEVQFLRTTKYFRWVKKLFFFVLRLCSTADVD